MKKSISLKFSNIAYPIFTLAKKPSQIVYTTDTIYCIRTPNGHRDTVDDKKLSGDYFARLLQMKNRITFDYTCKNIQELIFSKSQWGIDSKAKIHDLSKRVAVPIEKRAVVKVSNNLVWLRNISYPFEIPTQENIRLEDKVYGTLVYVNGEWFLREFSYDSKLVRPYIYV